MKTLKLTISALVCALLFTTTDAYAQMDERQPGIYAIVGEESIPLQYTNGVNDVATTGILGFEVGRIKYSYKGAESGTVASDTFVLVIDPKKKSITQSLKSYNPFIKSMTPGNMLILPLYVERGKRFYEQGKIIAGINMSVKDMIDFEWERISDNSFEIRVKGLIPGEYGIVFRPAKLGEFAYEAIFGFTYPEQQ